MYTGSGNFPQLDFVTMPNAVYPALSGFACPDRRRCLVVSVIFTLVTTAAAGTRRPMLVSGGVLLRRIYGLATAGQNAGLTQAWTMNADHTPPQNAVLTWHLDHICPNMWFNPFEGFDLEIIAGQAGDAITQAGAFVHSYVYD